MSSLNVAGAIAEWTEKQVALPFTIYVDEIPDAEGDCASLRYDPAPRAEKRFQDGTSLASWNLTFYVRCSVPEEALFWSKRFSDAVDGKSVPITETLAADCEAVTLPHFIDIDAKGNTIYGASIKCTYLEGD